jgi:hypothetical protein
VQCRRALGDVPDTNEKDLGLDFPTRYSRVAELEVAHWRLGTSIERHKAELKTDGE